MIKIRKIIEALIFIGLLAPAVDALDWPVWPDSAWRPVSGLFGVFQDASIHNGIDIAVPAGTAIFAIKTGFVKAVMTPRPDDIEGVSFWRIAIGDSAGTSACDALLYAHVNPYTISVQVGDTVAVGDSLGAVVFWYNPITVEHLHLARIRYSGDSASWARWDQWVVVGNPMEFLAASDDDDAPVLQNAYGGQLFAFCRNNAVEYFPADRICGDVDIICRGYDQYNFFGWMGCPFRFEYKIDGDSSLPWMQGISFSGPIGRYNAVGCPTFTLYQDDFICNSVYAWEDDPWTEQAYYYNITNSDGDSIIEDSDRDVSWQTMYFHNGQYMVRVRAIDLGGNVTEDSMTVTLMNAHTLSGTVGFSDGNPYLSGTKVAVVPDGKSGMTGSSGSYVIDSIGGGVQQVTVSRLGYVSVDTAVLMIEHIGFNVTLVPAPFVCGDADLNGTVNIRDITRIIDFLYKGGPVTYPRGASDANGDGTTNIKDVTYLITYLYKDGPDPVCP